MSKEDSNKKTRTISLIALIIVLICVGFLTVTDIKNSNTETTKANYLEALPEWAYKYDKHLKKYYKESYEIAFIDLDFDNNAEAIIKENNKKSISYTVLDLNEENNVAFKYNDINDIRMIYSHNTLKVSWNMTTSLADGTLHIIDIQKRIKESNEYESYLNTIELNNFKKNNISIDYEIKYTNIIQQEYQNNYTNAIKLYEKENSKIKKTIIETTNR